MTRSPSHRSAPTCATPDRRVTKAGQPYTDNVRPIPIEDIRRIFNGPVTAEDFDGAMPSARAGRASHGARSGLHYSATIAIAWLRRHIDAICIAVAVGSLVYFLGMLAIGAVS